MGFLQLLPFLELEYEIKEEPRHFHFIFADSVTSYNSLIFPVVLKTDRSIMTSVEQLLGTIAVEYAPI